MDAFSQNEFEALLEDNSKSIAADIEWVDDEDHSPTMEFRVEVESQTGHPLFVRGSFNPLANAAAFALIHRGVGRIYCLCVGKDHHNPSCQYVGDLHKHRWTEQFRDKEAYVPTDITAGTGNLALLWSEFCSEARISHSGTFHVPTGVQEDLFQ